MSTILSVKNLKLYYRTVKGAVKAVDNVSFNLNRGETLAIVGESGCGKTSLARALIRLLPRNVHTYEGSIIFNGTELMKLSNEEFRKRILWRKISMVFQGAQNSLNPVLKIGFQVAEPLMVHYGMDEKAALKKAEDAIKLVGIDRAFVNRYPFELSGGMKQRVVIAMALVTEPEIVILDEPTSALDVLTQANIMNLLKKLKEELRLSYIFITHDIALSSELADKVAVMYAGHLVEVAYAETFYREPLHPYSKKLMASVPTLRSEKKLEYIPGTPPSLIEPPSGCRFHPRCPYAFDKCKREPPPMFKVKEELVRCWLYEGGYQQ